jgi:hypothetical protein
VCLSWQEPQRYQVSVTSVQGDADYSCTLKMEN